MGKENQEKKGWGRVVYVRFLQTKRGRKRFGKSGGVPTTKLATAKMGRGQWGPLSQE